MKFPLPKKGVVSISKCFCNLSNRRKIQIRIYCSIWSGWGQWLQLLQLLSDHLHHKESLLIQMPPQNRQLQRKVVKDSQLVNTYSNSKNKNYYLGMGKTLLEGFVTHMSSLNQRICQQLHKKSKQQKQYSHPLFLDLL